MYDFRRITLFYLERRLSKHKMTIFSKHLWETMAPLPPLATPMPGGHQSQQLLAAVITVPVRCSGKQKIK